MSPRPRKHRSTGNYGRKDPSFHGFTFKSTSPEKQPNSRKRSGIGSPQFTASSGDFPPLASSQRPPAVSNDAAAAAMKDATARSVSVSTASRGTLSSTNAAKSKSTSAAPTQTDLSINGASDSSYLSTGGGLQRGMQVEQHHGNHLHRKNHHYNTNNNTRSQAKAGGFRSSGGKYLQSVRSRLKCFCRGSSQYRQKIKPTKEAILRSAVQVHPSPTDFKHTPIFSAALHGRLSEEQIAVNDALKSFLIGGSGIVDDRKPADVFRIMGENINSICLYDDSRCQEKVTKIRQINQRFQTDMALFNELGVDLRQVLAEKRLDQLLGN